MHDMNISGAVRPRQYRMVARAKSAEENIIRLLDVALEMFTEHPYDDVSLEAIATRVGMTQRTLLRRFGTKETLFVEAMMRAARRVMSERDAAPVGDVPGAVANVVASYENFGPNRLRLLAQADRIPVIAENVEGGRQYHRQWVERTFAPQVKGLRGAARKRRVAALVAITDVYMWKLLRRDWGLSQSDTEKVMVDLISNLKGGN